MAFGLWLAFGLGYHTLFEWQLGKTVGKYLVGIEVTNDDGTPISLGTSLGRNVLRLVDFLPMFYGLGVVAIVLSGRNKRLGDRLSNTVVVPT